MFSYLSSTFSKILDGIKGTPKLTEAAVDAALTQVHDALLEADVPYDVVQEFLKAVRAEVVGHELARRINPGDYVIKIIHDKLIQFLGSEKKGLHTYMIPSTIMLIGLQGSGKTTTIAKLARSLQEQAAARGKKRTIMCASLDYYRPAAIEQLETLAKQVGIMFYRPETTDPLQAATMIQAHARKNNVELLLLDTAGRLQIDEVMMNELERVANIIKPRYTYLVLDAMTGQQSLAVAQTFNDRMKYTGAILTKMDSDTRAGAAFAFRYVVDKPIVYVGTGERMSDLESFHPKRVAGRILGMGDVVSLMEKAERTIDTQQQESMTRRMFSGKFNLQDFADQMNAFSQLGSLKKIVQYLPGAGNISSDVLDQGQGQLRQFKAIISSMTPKERFYPQILDGSRKKRVARGSGTSVTAVNQLLEKFEQSKQFVRMLGKSGRKRRF